MSAICGWDHSGDANGGAQARSEAMAELSVYIHGLMTQPQLSDWFAEAEAESLNSEQTAVLREMKRHWQQANVLPESLVEAKSLAVQSVSMLGALSAKQTTGPVLKRTGLKW